MTTKKLFEICEQHGLYCEMDGNLVHLTNKKGQSYETIKAISGNLIHSTEYSDINLYDWLGY